VHARNSRLPTDYDGPEQSQPGRQASQALAAAIACLAGILVGCLIAYFISQQQLEHADSVRMQEKRELTYLSFIASGQTLLETLPAIDPKNLNTASAAIEASRQFDDDLTNVQIVGTPDASGAAVAVWQAISDGFAQVLNGRISGSDAVNLQSIATTRALFVQTARIDTGFES
jgi:hypothetical protein